MITKEQVTAWVANNQIGYNSEADFIHQCIQDLTPTSEWISADDRLPIERYCVADSTRRVLVTDGLEVYEMTFAAGERPYNWYEWRAYGDLDPDMITHWQPLPAPPEEI